MMKRARLSLLLLSLAATVGACAPQREASSRPAPLSDDDRARALEAARLLERGEAEAAEPLLRELRRRYPRDLGLALAHAEALLELDRPSEARAAIGPFEDHAPGALGGRSSAALYVMRARVVLHEGDRARAEAILNEASARHPESPAPLLTLLELEANKRSLRETIAQSLPLLIAPPLRLFELSLRLAFDEEDAELIGALAARLVEAHPSRAQSVLDAFEERLLDEPALYLRLVLAFKDEPEIVGRKLAAKEALRTRQRDR